MIKFSKRISAFVCAVLLALCTSVCVFAESTQKLKDDADLFSEDEFSYITSKLESLSDKTGWDTIIYTNYNYVDSDDMEDECNDYYDDNDYGIGSKKSGVFLTIDMGSREIYIVTKGEAMYYFSDERIDDVKSEIISCLGSDDYYDAAVAFIEYTEKYYDEGKPEDGNFTNLEINEKQDNPTLYLIKHYGIFIVIGGLAAGSLAVVFTVLRYKNNGKENIYNLKDNSSAQIEESHDEFLHKSVSVTTISSSSGRSGSRGHSSGGSSSHGGGGGSF